MRQFMSAFKKIWSDRRGYGTVELMVIIAILGAVAVAVGNKFQTSFPASAENVSTKIDDHINAW